MTKGNLKDEKQSNSKQKILRKSVELFYKKGFARASIRDIAKAANIRGSTVYHYFKNKDEILFKIICDEGLNLLRILNSLMDQYDDPVQCFREMIFRQICLMSGRQKEIKIFMEDQYQLPPRLREEAIKRHREIYDLYYRMICELERRGFLKEGDMTVKTFSIFALMNWVYRWFRSNGRLTIEQVANEVIDIYVRGILKDEVEIYQHHLSSEGEYGYSHHQPPKEP